MKCLHSSLFFEVFIQSLCRALMYIGEASDLSPLSKINAHQMVEVALEWLSPTSKEMPSGMSKPTNAERGAIFIELVILCMEQIRKIGIAGDHIAEMYAMCTNKALDYVFTKNGKKTLYTQT